MKELYLSNVRIFPFLRLKNQKIVIDLAYFCKANGF